MGRSVVAAPVLFWEKKGTTLRVFGIGTGVGESGRWWMGSELSVRDK
jgi:hypothetical protein